MKEVRQSLLNRSVSPIIIIAFVLVLVQVLKDLKAGNYIFNIIFTCMSLILIAAAIIGTAYYFRWKIEFDNEHFIFRSLFQKPILIKYNNIEKISVRNVHYKDCIHNNITFHLTNNTPSVFHLSLPTNAENYSEFFNLLMIKTE